MLMKNGKPDQLLSWIVGSACGCVRIQCLMIVVQEEGGGGAGMSQLGGVEERKIHRGWRWGRGHEGRGLRRSR